MRKKIMNVVLFLAVLAAALGMTLYVGNSAASVLIYNFIFLGIIAVVYIVGLLGGMFRMNKLSLALKDAADELESDMTNMTRVSHTVLEQVLTDIFVSDPEWRVVLLRYFNPIGAHKSGLIGEDPKGIPNNLMPYISQTAIGRFEYLRVFGDDYNTPDGTGVRDYIHVVDLARGHVAAISYMDSHPGELIFNLGTGKGCSVLELVHAFEKANKLTVPYKIVGRRAGDIDECYCSPEKSRRELGWTAQYNVEDMCRDSWHWQTLNPNGYRDE